MKIMKATCIAAALAGCGVAMAAAPVLHVTKTTTIDAPADKVWSASKDFNALNTWHPALASDELVEGTNNTVGAVRLLTLKGGGTIKEKLLGFDDAHHTFRYQILEGVLPVSDYTSHFSVKAVSADRARVTWSGSFKRKNTGDAPSDKENDQAAVAAITGVYQSGLDNLKKMVEAQ